jgi:hypothetical protein
MGTGFAHGWRYGRAWRHTALSGRDPEKKQNDSDGRHRAVAIP